MSSVIEINNNDIEELCDKLPKLNYKISKNVESINTFIFYLENNDFVNYKKLEINLTNNKLTKKELISIVMEYNTLHNKKFDLIGIYKFEPNINEDQILDYCKNNIETNFFSQYKTIQDIDFNPTYEILSDDNSLILLFSKKVKKDEKKQSKNKTKKKVKFLLETKAKSGANKTLKTT